MRSSKEQMADELNEMYQSLVDPEKIEQREREEERREKLKELKEDYGL